ncbi:MAG: hypothetical protein B9J98_06285 [Candidatus Terraquivivens tikiterensis]|uniref:Phosphoserine phosphatase n=1 Tax=Candidatus Terraquivivens tikiterensis TaxID=1980982 RepID=A0A2R7Y1X3_9ARCH|nr:MAG: hypothetical protein B9J98_06285 [Candidatus Terraquivivens tikiterensis]
MTMEYGDVEVERLKEKIKELSSTIKQLEGAARELSKDLDSLHEKKKEVRQRFLSMIDEKKKVLESYKKLKSDLKECYALRGTLVKQLRVIEKETKHLRGCTDVGTMRERIKSIEWTIHTSILKPSEERRLFLEAKKLEEAVALIEKRDSLVASIRAQDEKIRSIEDELSGLRNKLNYFNDEIGKLKDAYEKLKKDADEKHRAYIQLKDRLSRAEAEQILLQSKLTVWVERVKKAMDDAARQKEEEFKKRVIAEAREKLLKGKKLTFQELKLLLESCDDFKL